MTNIEQQIQWLAESYGGLMPIAMKRLQSVPKAEDAVSTAMESALMQIRYGRCRAATLAQFCAWIHQIVRWRCSKRLKQGATDLPVDVGAKYLRAEVRSDRRNTSFVPVEDDDWQKDCYTRNEHTE
jgi:DNA-directed RNA polymerase specialized sigma24 family protein